MRKLNLPVKVIYGNIDDAFSETETFSFPSIGVWRLAWLAYG